MKQHKTSTGKIVIKLMLIMILLVLLSPLVASLPSGPTINVIFNETKSPSAASMINTSGGTITTVFLNATTQNPRWKAYVGNVTGTMTLDDANDNTVFDWSLTRIQGEVYATRFSGSVNWSGINCSTTEQIEQENALMNHSYPDDNITATFDESTHGELYVGTRQILENTCSSLHTYVNSTSQASSFEEVVLNDGDDATSNVVFATPLEDSVQGFDNSAYDFQMILPENGLPTYSSSTAYYFYVELT